MPPRRFRRTVPVAAIGLSALGLFVAASAVHAAWRLSHSAALARDSEPLQAAPAQPGARLLVVGDSTAVGTGASSAQTSLVGLIARDHPNLAIVNRATDGARYRDIAAQIEAAGAARFDAALVLGGGNDVIRLTGAAELRDAVERVAALARSKADFVVLMPAGNVGNAPFFFAPWSWWMTQRSRDLHAAVRDAAQRHGATYVNLFKERADDPFAQQPARLHARDGLHPSDDGYALWHAELQAQAGWSGRLDGAQRVPQSR